MEDEKRFFCCCCCCCYCWSTIGRASISVLTDEIFVVSSSPPPASTNPAPAALEFERCGEGGCVVGVCVCVVSGPSCVPPCAYACVCACCGCDCSFSAHEVGRSTHCDGFSSSSLHLVGGGTATHTRMLWFGSGDGTFPIQIHFIPSFSGCHALIGIGHFEGAVPVCRSTNTHHSFQIIGRHIGTVFKFHIPVFVNSIRRDTVG
mmetsp:Transcript_34758/g.39926  ORF Transcript_34758/g.39926 Transcript_34758/m.39926 type:complete len:204 (+) Transcript_34758:946-1557(+)